MHILASGPELQAVYSGHLIHPSYSILPPLSPTLFNIYINELARALEQSAAPGFTLLESEVKCLLCADELVRLYPTKEGLQQHLALLHRYCQTWALTLNLSKTKNNGFLKRSLSGPQIQIPSRHRCPTAHKKTIHTSA